MADYPEGNEKDVLEVYIQHLAGEEGLWQIYTYGDNWIAYTMWFEADGGWTSRIEFFGDDTKGMLTVNGFADTKELAKQNIKAMCEKVEARGFGV